MASVVLQSFASLGVFWSGYASAGMGEGNASFVLVWVGCASNAWDIDNAFDVEVSIASDLESPSIAFACDVGDSYASVFLFRPVNLDSGNASVAGAVLFFSSLTVQQEI